MAARYKFTYEVVVCGDRLEVTAGSYAEAEAEVIRLTGVSACPKLTLTGCEVLSGRTKKAGPRGGEDNPPGGPGANYVGVR